MPIRLSAQLADSGFQKANTVRLMAFLKQVKVEQGQHPILTEGEANELYFIERGMALV